MSGAISVMVAVVGCWREDVLLPKGRTKAVDGTTLVRRLPVYVEDVGGNSGLKGTSGLCGSQMRRKK